MHFLNCYTMIWYLYIYVCNMSSVSVIIKWSKHQTEYIMSLLLHIYTDIKGCVKDHLSYETHKASYHTQDIQYQYIRRKSAQVDKSCIKVISLCYKRFNLSCLYCSTWACERLHLSSKQLRRCSSHVPVRTSWLECCWRGATCLFGRQVVLLVDVPNEIP